MFIIDIEMSPSAKELEYKRAQRKQAQMTNMERFELSDANLKSVNGCWPVKQKL